jgi:Concanavalin A-like lectin/glucanases superfamily
MSWFFDSVDDHVDSGVETLGSFATFAAWIHPFSVGENSLGMIVAHGGTDRPRMGLQLCNTPVNSLQFRAEGNNGAWVSGANAITLGVWQHVAASLDGTGFPLGPAPSLYVNGQPVANTVVTAPAGALATDNVVFYIGNSSTTARTFNGRIGEVAIWPRVLSPVEINNVYVLGVGAVPDYGWYFPGDAGSRQQFPRGTLALTLVGAIAGENPPARPAGRRG